ncbi:LysM peptidoglycan-binding domain-containing protein [Rhodohalobacter sp. SW132]|uniref:LysM peptidoglycan-binding domain-containing protein n=1 Tax=Rhodohalobacter sp. SW132 TaxID=2293433 RepID=UPI000E266421|nr:LysM peptidoglycan-binding domain-containing protein [Rhodohalobacter sp. SW132]REL39242.1 LysM peptidoglycan-binding domain-containing protein [Rhodohalobacter sp. SW132]
MLHRILLILSAAIIALTLSLYADTVYAQEAGQTHTVQSGETLFSISREYDVAVGDLRRWNDLDSDNLSPGQELLVGPPTDQDAITHTVQSGETLFGISRQYGVTIAEIQTWNNLEAVQVSTGQELTIYQAEPADERTETLPDPSEIDQADEEDQARESIVRDRSEERGTAYYTVRSGDTLTQIAREHNMTVAQLRNLNNLQSDVINVGQRITVRDVQTAPSIAEGAEESTPQGKFVNYHIESGESLKDIKEKFRMSEDELSALNPDLNISSLSSGQSITVLLPPSRSFENPYRKGASLDNLGEVPVTVYNDSDKAGPTTSGELYNPDHLTAGHANMPLGNVVYIENPDNNRGVYVRINDRTSGSGIKLSHKAFSMLGFSSIQQANVVVYLDQ